MFKSKVHIFYFITCPFLIISASMISKANDPDLFWHLKVGEYIVNNLSIPRTDLYSWSVYGEPWIAHQWFADVILYISYKHLNLYGLWVIVFVCLILTALFIYKGLITRDVSNLSASIVAVLTVMLLFFWIRPWPQVLMYVLFSAYLMLSLQNQWNITTLIKVAIISTTWANIHSSAVMFPLLLLVESLWYFATKNEHITKTKKRILAAGIAALCTILNPHGINLWMYAVGEGLLSGVYRKYISSWRPYDFSVFWLAFIFFASAFLIYFIINRDKQDSKLELMRGLGFWSLALISRLYMPYAIMSTFILLGFLNLKTSVKLSKFINILFVIVGIIALIINPIPNDLEKYSQGKYPVEAATFIKEQGLNKVFNDHGWGGYLLFREIPVYIDGRNDVYRDIFDNYAKIFHMKVPVSSSIREAGATTVLTRESGSLDVYLSERVEWKELYRDEISVIFGLMEVAGER